MQQPRLHTSICWLVLSAAGLAACGTPEDKSTEPAWFNDRASSAGTTFVTRSRSGERRFDFPEIMLGGVGLADVDRDGDLDVALIQGGDIRAVGGPTDQLWRNGGGFKFTPESLDDDEYGMGCAFGDIDDDGWVDLYVTNVGPNLLHRNRSGKFYGTDQARDEAWGTSAAFGDPDGDGDLDLFVANYLLWSLERERECGNARQRDYCQPNSYRAPARDSYFENDGTGGLTDRSDELGLNRAVGHGLGCAFVDVDGNGRSEIFVANDGTANHLWRLSDDRLHEVALISGCALSGTGKEEAGMGVAVFDFDTDGDLDLLSVHLRNQSNTLYDNRGNGAFADRTARAGLALASFPWTGFGVRASDFDFDGELDVALAHGRVLNESPYADPNDHYAEADLLFRGLGQGRFEPVPGALPPLALTSRGLAAGDLDGDGDIDLVMTAIDKNVVVYENTVADGNRWIAFEVRRASGAFAIGARVEMEAQGASPARFAWVARDGSYLSASEPTVRFATFAIGGDAVARVNVRLPNGRVQTWEDLAVNRVHVLQLSE